MQKDAHYYAVLAFARVVGFNKKAAHTLAYASQFVDDAKINHIVAKGKRNDLENTLIEDNETHFLNMATCHNYFRSRTFNFSAMMNNTCAFHFIPGCDDKITSRKFKCRKESKVIVAIIEDAINDNGNNSLYKFGIALHAYADTFSHQGFAGLPNKVNDIYNPTLHHPLITYRRIWENKLRCCVRTQLRKIDMCITNYGHGQVFSNPDISHVIWSYEYDDTPYLMAMDQKKSKGQRETKELKATGDIENPKRFKEAFVNIIKYLNKYIEKHEEIIDHDFLSVNSGAKQEKFDYLYKVLVQDPKFLKSKEKVWIDKIIELKLYDISETVKYIKYNKHKWLKEAFLNYNKRKFNHRYVSDAVLNETIFKKSDWYNFYNAVYWYKPKFYAYCRDNGLDIPNDYLPKETLSDDSLLRIAG